MFMTLKNETVNILLILSIFFYGLDSYSVFDVPFSWIGLALILAIAVVKDLRILLNLNLYLLIALFLMPTLFSIIPIGLSEINMNLFLRAFNIISFLIVFQFSLNYFSSANSSNFLDLLQKLILIFSLFAIYTYFAQIYDLPEFVRNRSNTGLLGDSLQTTFWQYEPHRAMGSFREPVLLSSVLLPLYFVYLFTIEKPDRVTFIIASLAIGLTRSDLVRVYCILFFILFMVDYLKNKKIHNALLPILLILFFSLIGIRECDLNPQSRDCLNSNIESSEIEAIVFNDIDETIKIGSDRSDVINYFAFSFRSLSPQGITNTNIGFSDYLSYEMKNEMYLTNRTLPRYLLSRYEAKNFGTGNYSLLEYSPNVQNLFVNYSLSLGSFFIVFLFLLICNFWISEDKNLNFYSFLLLVFFFFLIPIEELNAFSALIMGVGYNMIIKDKSLK